MQRRLTRRSLAVWLAICTGAAWTQEPARDGGAVLHGRVQIAGDQFAVPVRRARVTLMDAASGTFSTDADADGQYTFDHLRAGTYRISASKGGFLPASSSAQRPLDPSIPVNIGAGQTVTMNLAMQRASAISGRFVDDEGTPLARLDVSAERLVNEPDGNVRSEVYHATTDDRGRFRAHTLPPGDYLVHARLDPPWSGERFYYPGVSNIAQAQRVRLIAGQELDHLDFTVSRPLPNPAMQDLEPPSTSRPRTTGDVTRVAGRVSRSDTGKALSDALVQIAAIGRAGLETTRTDAAGRFEFTALAAGQYTVIVTADGFVAADANVLRAFGGGTVIDLQDRQRLDMGDVTLVPTSAIEGHILDEFGDPVPGVNVQLEQVVFVAGRSRLMPTGIDRGRDTGPTDDQGRFRLYGLAPGDYYLIASTGPFRLSGSSPSSQTDEGIAGFAPTHFPGTRNAGDAKPVHVESGRDVIEVAFALGPARMAVVSGSVRDAAAQPVDLARVILQQTVGGDVRDLMAATTASHGGGVFTIRNVPPGSYVLQALAQGKFGSALLTVPENDDGTDSGAVAVTVYPMATVRGHFSFENGAAPPPKDRVRVLFVPTDFVSGPLGGNATPSHINDDWDFDIGPLASTGVIRVITPAGWALKRIAIDGRDVTDTPYDFRTADVSGIEILLTNRTASVSGVVLDQDKPVPTCLVVVFSDDATKWEFPSRFLLGALSTQQGSFVIRGLLPGRYLAAALPKGVSEPTPAHLAALRGAATPFIVSEGDTARLTLKRSR